MACGPTLLSQGPISGGAVLILCTFGTHPQPFERALSWVADAAGEERLIVQHGSTPPRPQLDGVVWHRFLDYEELVAAMGEADVVVSHAGVGTLMTAIQAGVVPVAIPRLREHGEHVDDHQLQIATELGESGYVVPCLGRTELGDCLRRAREMDQPEPEQGGELRGVAIAAAGGDPQGALRGSAGR